MRLINCATDDQDINALLSGSETLTTTPVGILYQTVDVTNGS